MRPSPATTNAANPYSHALSILLRGRRHPLTALLQLHARLAVVGAFSVDGPCDAYVAGVLLSSLSPRSLHHSRLFLAHLPRRALEPFHFNTLLAAHLAAGDVRETMSLYSCMLAAGVRPNNYTLSFLLRAAAGASATGSAAVFHGHVIRCGYACYDFVFNGLIHLYGLEHDAPGGARKLFEESPCKDVVSWTSLIGVYVKYGLLASARELFDRMPLRNEVSWASMINGYAEVGEHDKALELFREMLTEGLEANHAAIVGVLAACGGLGALDQGMWVHAYARRIGLRPDRVLGTALVDMYAKCGSVDAAWEVFDAMADRDVFAHTAMISGFSNHGRSSEAVALFDRMEAEGVRPNSVTLICVLSACGRIGLVDRGREVFASMKAVHGIEPEVQHYGSFIDLLGRAGLLEEAKAVLWEMPMPPDSYVLGALLNACVAHGDVDAGKKIVAWLAELGLDHSGVHVQLSNAYATSRQWEDVSKVRETMEGKQVAKLPGCSVIEAGGEAREFIAADMSMLPEITSAVEEMDRQLKSDDSDFIREAEFIGCL